MRSICHVAMCCCLLAALGVPATAAEAAAADKTGTLLPLHTEGRWIVDRGGQRVKLQSVNWYGAEEQDHVVAGLELQDIRAIARRIRAFGFNSVRLPWSNELVETNPVVPDYTVTANPQLRGKRALQVFDATVQALAGEGLYIILDNHTSNGDWCCSNTDGNGLWYNQDYPESSWLADWRTMAARYKGVPNVIAADLRNEPRAGASWGGSAVTDWHGAAERGGNAVLSVNPHLLIMVEGINYSLDLTGVANLPVKLSLPNRLVYSPHDYSFSQAATETEAQLFGELDTAWGYIATTANAPYTAPIWIGEFGNCHDQSSCLSGPAGSGGFWFQSFRDYLDQHDFDFSYWAINGTQARGTGRTFGYEESYGILNPYWNAPATPSEINPAPSTNLLAQLQTVFGPNQGPGIPAKLAPSVVLISPLPQALVNAGASVTVAADAFARGSQITRVDFFADGSPIGSAAAAPYAITWSNVPAGVNKLTASAVAQNGSEAKTLEDLQLVSYDFSADTGLQPGDSISINFGDYNVTDMALTETAGVIARPNWNGAYGNSGYLPALLDGQGGATEAAVSWASSNMYFSGIPDQPGNSRMMKGYQDNSNVSPTEIDVSGIPPSFGRYDVYVYFNSDTGTAFRNGNYQLTAKGAGAGCAASNAVVQTGLQVPGDAFSGAFAQALNGSNGNYLKFPDCSGSGFTLLAVHGGSSDPQYRVPVNGLQIVAR